jgi:3-methyl-2-oxobutanoate hydroxymethyltransferase
MNPKVTIHTLKRMKQASQKIGMVTAYDATFASIFDAAGVDVLLVGDSLGMVIQGEKSTLTVTMDQMVYHCRAVSRTVQRAHIVGDLPFMSYQAGANEAVKNAGRLVAEGYAESVKLEGGEDYADVVERIVRAGIPVMGHLGLTPQSVHRMGGYVVQGRDQDQAAQLLRDAKAVEAAGAYALVLEGIPLDLGRQITQALSIPTIGIGAGVHTDGQVLVSYDLLGMNPHFAPKFVKRYADLHGVITKAVGEYLEEVRAQAFPTEAQSFRGGPVRVVKTDADGEEKPGPVYGVPV